MDAENKNYPISFRLIRFKIKENNYETIITNLNNYEFGSEDIKRIYNIRWTIETSFRDLKHSLGLIRLHSKGYDCRDRFKNEILFRSISCTLKSGKEAI